ncbi:MAG: PKD domain-containing protein [Thermoplasmata archaeon]
MNFTEFGVSPQYAYVGEEVTFFANASSSTSSTLRFTIFYDAYIPPFPTVNPASAVTVNDTGNPGNVVQKFTYNALGNFTFTGEDITFFWVRLYVDDGTTNISSLAQVFVKLNSPPEFIVVLTDDGTYKDVPLNLSIEVMDVDNDPIYILWEFGDGTVATNTTDGTREDSFANQTHVWSPYVEPGTGGYTVLYKLNVTATDSFDNSITVNATITVSVPENGPPMIALTSSSNRVQPGESILLWANATDPEGDPLTWTFNYSDGTTEVVHTDWTEPGTLVWCNMTHAYDEVGSYTIAMHVSDALGENQVFPHNRSASISVTIAINRVPGVTSFIIVSPESPEINVTIGFIDVYLSIQAYDPDGDVLTASWYIGDAVDPVVNVSAGGIGVYSFIQVMTITEPGSYNVSVVVTDGYEGHEVTVNRTINATSNNRPPSLRVFDFAYASGEHAVPMEEIEFLIVISDPEQDPIEVTLEFGDDSPKHYFNLTDYVDGNVTLIINHTYELQGIYTGTLWFTDNKIGIWNHSKVVTFEVTVEEEVIEDISPPVADAGPDQTVMVGAAVTFDGSGSTDNVGITNYTWTFTDGTAKTLYGVSPTYAFETPGTYTVTQNVTDAAGSYATDTVIITVLEVNEPPVADAGDDQTVTVGDEVTFDGSGSSDLDGTIDNYTWSFTYDSVATEIYDESATFAFDIAGTYTVTLTVTDDDGDTDTDTVTITVEEEDDEKSFLESYGLPIGIVLALIVAALVAFFVMKGLKGGKKPESTELDSLPAGEPEPPENQV